MFVYEQINSANPYAMPDELKYLRAESFKLNEQSQIVVLGCGPFVMGLSILEQHILPPKIAVVDNGTFYYAEVHLRGAGIDLGAVQFIAGDTSEAGEVWTKPIDLLVVDADHTFEGCRKDILSWWPHVKVRGLAFFHDAKEREGGFNGSGTWEWGPVYRAIESSYDSTWQFIKAVGISMVYMKV